MINWEGMMVVVYLKNGEKAPMPDANYVKLENGPETSVPLLRVFFGNNEVGHFKWDDVTGYTIAASRSGSVTAQSYEAWAQRLEG
jgi:hypothetical protein